LKKELDVISQLDKGERIVDICRKVRFANISLRTLCDNGDRITESAKSGTKVFV